MAQRREDLRAADKDRQFVAEQLRQALDEGRLNLAEYDERLQQAYAARTYGDLDGILDDLPGVTPVAASQVVPAAAAQPAAQSAAPPGHHMARWLAWMWSSWLTTALIVIVVWLATGADYFWPIWVIGPWGALLLARTLGGMATGAHHNMPGAGNPRPAGDQPGPTADDRGPAPFLSERERRRDARYRRRDGRYR